ncbi:MAG: NUDIX hydrolase, partial [Myxococcota bacterium]|nr:NUDIX hydrolase [Myxococcota bacterium]
MREPKPWKHEKVEWLQDCRVFRVGRSMAHSPHGGDPHPFYRIDAEDWVNVVPLTPSGELVMVKQYRHGSRSVTLEIPGGIIEPGESPALAAARETLEETGYAGSTPELLGNVNPNPAVFGNRVHTYLIPDVEAVSEIANSPTEETVVELVPADRIPSLLKDG